MTGCVGTRQLPSLLYAAAGSMQTQRPQRLPGLQEQTRASWNHVQTCLGSQSSSLRFLPAEVFAITTAAAAAVPSVPCWLALSVRI